jgi:hypothetical protein
MKRPIVLAAVLLLLAGCAINFEEGDKYLMASQVLNDLAYPVKVVVCYKGDCSNNPDFTPVTLGPGKGFYFTANQPGSPSPPSVMKVYAEGTYLLGCIIDESATPDPLPLTPKRDPDSGLPFSHVFLTSQTVPCPAGK